MGNQHKIEALDGANNHGGRSVLFRCKRCKREERHLHRLKDTACAGGEGEEKKWVPLSEFLFGRIDSIVPQFDREELHCVIDQVRELERGFELSAAIASFFASSYQSCKDKYWSGGTHATQETWTNFPLLQGGREQQVCERLAGYSDLVDKSHTKAEMELIFAQLEKAKASKEGEGS